MSIGGIASIGGGISPISRPVPGIGAAEIGPGGDSFKDAVARGLQSVSNQEHQADGLSQALAAGEQVQIHDVMAATTKAQLSVDLLVQVRNKAVDAYREIMNMQV